jgi:preprotein translocase subunit YajC
MQKETVMLLAGALFMLLNVFHKPIGLSDDWEWPFLIVAGACWVGVFVLQRRQKSRRSASAEMASPPANLDQERNLRWLSLILMIAVSLSGPWWLPYTGIRLPFPQLVAIAIITCITCVIIYFIASRRRRPKI